MSLFLSLSLFGIAYVPVSSDCPKLLDFYRVYIYNLEDVVLCALPYHDTHAFVRIVQLLSPG